MPASLNILADDEQPRPSDRELPESSIFADRYEPITQTLTAPIHHPLICPADATNALSALEPAGGEK